MRLAVVDGPEVLVGLYGLTGYLRSNLTVIALP